MQPACDLSNDSLWRVQVRMRDVQITNSTYPCGSMAIMLAASGVRIHDARKQASGTQRAGSTSSNGSNGARLPPLTLAHGQLLACCSIHAQDIVPRS